MKNQLLRPLGLLALAFVLASQTISAQGKKDLYSSTVWIKGQDATPLNGNPGNAVKKYYNFNPSIDFTNDKIQKKFKGVVEKASSLFMVFNGDSAAPDDLLSLKNGEIITTLSTAKVYGSDKVAYHKGNVNQGILVSYLYNKNSILSKKRGNLSLNEPVFSGGKNSIQEILYIPRVLGEKERQIVESYLSVKYGISLLDEKDYYDSGYEKIWDSKSNGGYNKRVTGIGRDDALGQYQKQSGNSEKDGLYFGLAKVAPTNAENKGTIDDRSYWVWGDNGKATIIGKNDQDLNEVKKMERIWSMQATGPVGSKNTFLQLVLNKKEFQKGVSPGPDEMVWLAIDTIASGGFDYKHAVYIPSKDLNDGNLTFENLLWKPNGRSLFTFVQAPDLLVTTDYLQPDCIVSQNGTLKIDIFGGKAPYQVQIHSDAFTKAFEVTEATLTIADLASGTYQLQVTDSSKHLYKSELVVDTFESSPISLNPLWFLDASKEVTVSPITKNEQLAFTYEWYKGGMLISTGKQFIGKESGEYKLQVTNAKGCQQVLNFGIVDKNDNAVNQWVVFPNPVASGSAFTVSFDFKKATKATVSIYDITGKLIQFKDLGSITTMQYKDSLIVSGTYTIVCSVNGMLQTSKLVVK